MEAHLFHLMALIVFNIMFFFFGTILNALVIVVFWQTTSLRKKHCYFMIMVLSCCDFLTVLVNHPVVVIITMLFFSKKFKIASRYVNIMTASTTIFQGASLLAVLVMNVDRYLSIFHPLYHKTNITKRRLFWLFAVAQFIYTTSNIFYTDELVYSLEVHSIIFMVLYTPPMLYTNYKLIRVSRKYRRSNAVKRGERRAFSLKQVSICLMAFACQLFFSIPLFIFIVCKIFVPETNTLYIRLWLKTIVTMNSTFNCLIFFWKNSILRTEAIKIIKEKMKLKCL